MYFGCACFKGELGFLNCDDICMCVVNKKFELFELFLYSVYVDPLLIIIIIIMHLYSASIQLPAQSRVYE